MMRLGMLIGCSMLLLDCDHSAGLAADDGAATCQSATAVLGAWYRVAAPSDFFSATMYDDRMTMLYPAFGEPVEVDLLDGSRVERTLPFTDRAFDVGMGAGPDSLLLMSGPEYGYAHLWDGGVDQWRTVALPEYLAPLPNYEVHFTGGGFAVYGASTDVSDSDPVRPIGALDIATGTWSDWRGAGAPERAGRSTWTDSGLFVWATDRVSTPAAWLRSVDGTWRSVSLEGGPTRSGGGVATWDGDVIVGANGDDRVWRYSPGADSWTGYEYPADIVSLSGRRSHQRLVSVVGDRVIMATACEYYAVLDLSTAEWSVTPAGEEMGAPPPNTLAQLGGATRFVVYGLAPEHLIDATGPVWVWGAEGLSQGTAGAGGAP